jgi:hypothetical protein
LTTISPSRVEAIGLVAAVNSMLPLPCPDAGDASDTQPTGVVTLQAHSGAAVIATVPIPPSDTIGAGSVTLSWHFTREGAVETTVVLDVPQATMLIIAAAKITSRSSGGRDEDLVGIAALMNALQAQFSSVHTACIPRASVPGSKHRRVPREGEPAL